MEQKRKLHISNRCNIADFKNWLKRREQSSEKSSAIYLRYIFFMIYLPVEANIFFSEGKAAGKLWASRNRLYNKPFLLLVNSEFLPSTLWTKRNFGRKYNTCLSCKYSGNNGSALDWRTFYTMVLAKIQAFVIKQ